MIIKVKLGSKGQLVIPKVVRESIGLRENGQAILEVKERKIEISTISPKELIRRMEERAKKHGGDTSKWIYGDRLYEEEFGKKYSRLGGGK